MFWQRKEMPKAEWKPVSAYSMLDLEKLPDPTPEVARAKVHLSDLHKACTRIDRAWNKTQMEDAIRSAEFFLSKIKSSLDIKD